MVNTPVDINQIKQLAATGHFRSIALWLNYPLVQQSIYARVQTDQHPGYLQVLLEFERSPKKDALIRVICNRLCQLESTVIRGVYLVARLMGTNQPLWQQRVRLSQRKRQARPLVKEPIKEPIPPSPTPPSGIKQPEPEAITPQAEESITATTYGSDLFDAVPSYLIPRESTAQERRRRQNRTVAPFPVVKIRQATVDQTQTSDQRRVNRRRLAPKEVIEQQFKYMRAFVVTGSAAAAFILGCVTEAMLTQRGQITRKAAPTLPTFNEDAGNEDAGWRTLSDVETQEIAYRSAMRGAAVPAALEPIAVMPHEPSSNPEDPTVTLVFGGEVPVGDVPLQTPDAVEQVLGELDIFREADVAMVGLGNSLASADTSLQENYFERSRPDAVDALLRGGIDIVGLTGDQTMDFGRQGLIETLTTLDSAGIYRVGAGRNHQEARRPEVLEVKGQRIAYLSYAPNSDDEGATLSRAGLNIQERDGIVEDIAALREAVDWVIVNYRWYGDLTAEPSAQQVNLSRAAIDAGADLVVGYHPQQLQGAELYKSRPIVYALGDFIFQDAPLEDHDTATLRVSLREKQMKVEFLPISVKAARPRAASGETAKSILKHIRQASDTLPSPLQFPAILEASPQSGLLKPEKSEAPLKTLGELEPGLSDGLVHPNEEFVPESDRFTPYDYGDSIPEIDSFDQNSSDTLNTFEELTPEPDSFGNVSEPMLDVSEPTGDDSPFDSFNIEPDMPALDGAAPYEIWESPLPIKPLTTPKVDSTRDTLDPFSDTDTNTSVDAAPNTEAIPESSDDILLPAADPLPGYDRLEDWGEKSSPHKEFNPIQEHLNSLEEPSDLELSSPPAVSPAVSIDASDALPKEASDAISPHDEPLVGPLS